MVGRWFARPRTGGELWPKDRHVRSFDGTRIRYTVLGPASAPMVTMCAGFLSPDTFWKYLVPGLTDTYRVLVWNYRGVGVSDLPREPGFHALNVRTNELTIEANARDLRVILDVEDVASTVIAGHSMGVQTALDAYRQFPERVAGLVSIAGAYRSPLRTFYGTDVSARLVPVALPLLHALPRVTLLAWRAAIASPASYAFGRYVLRAAGPRTKARDMAGYFEHLSLSDPLIAAKMIRAMHGHSAEALLEDLKVPVLIVHGTADPFTPALVAVEMNERIPEAELVLLEGGTHTLPLEYPRETLDVLRPYLDDVLRP